MISIKQINNECVKPVIAKRKDGLKIKGAELFNSDNKNPNVFLCARKKSGKTSTIFKILKNCMLKETTLIIFCSTVDKDPTYKVIVNYFRDKGANVLTYTSLYENKVNKLEVLLKYLETEAKAEAEREQQEKEAKLQKKQMKGMGQMNISTLPRRLMINPEPEEEEEEPETKRKRVYEKRDFILVFDDLSTELKDKNVEALLKKNRHYNAMCLVSSQYAKDIQPASLKQIDFFIIFKGIDDDKLKHIFNNIQLKVNIDIVLSLYDKATEQPYSFLWIDIEDQKFRRNFNCEFQLE